MLASCSAVNCIAFNSDVGVLAFTSSMYSKLELLDACALQLLVHRESDIHIFGSTTSTTRPGFEARRDQSCFLDLAEANHYHYSSHNMQTE